nr:carboxymuconolactone decarboxylase family protein [uncultured Brevundimonas sp.]
MDEAERLELGFRTRRSVLGDAHVDRSIANTTEHTAEFQDLITRYAWGTIWTRPAIEHATRRLMVLSMMIALNRSEEFRLHVRAALAHGVAPELIKEVILQAAIYCGVPAANAAFHDLSLELECHAQQAEEQLQA